MASMKVGKIKLLRKRRLKRPIIRSESNIADTIADFRNKIFIIFNECLGLIF